MSRIAKHLRVGDHVLIRERINTADEGGLVIKVEKPSYRALVFNGNQSEWFKESDLIHIFRGKFSSRIGYVFD